jgi:hypothetical protein
VIRDRESYENGLFTIRFIGEGLNTHGVGIYDLAQTLLAVQRIVHKAYLAQHDRLEKGAFPNREERERLALQIGERRRSSDAFALVPLLADPFVLEAMKKIADYVASGVVGYYVGDLLKRAKSKDDEHQRIFIGSIYGEVVNIANRVNAAGGVESISIGSPALGRETIASFTPKTKEYLGSLRGEIYLGRKMSVKGSVYKMYPSSRIVSIRRPAGKKVDIFLGEEDFDAIRYHPKENPYFIFHGRPRYQLGIETKEVTEFEADSIEEAKK